MENKDSDIKKITFTMPTVIAVIVFVFSGTWGAAKHLGGAYVTSAAFIRVVEAVDTLEELTKKHALSLEGIEERTRDRYTFTMEVNMFLQQKLVYLESGRLEDAQLLVDPREQFKERYSLLSSAE